MCPSVRLHDCCPQCARPWRNFAYPITGILIHLIRDTINRKHCKQTLLLQLLDRNTTGQRPFPASRIAGASLLRTICFTACVHQIPFHTGQNQRFTLSLTRQPRMPAFKTPDNHLDAEPVCVFPSDTSDAVSPSQAASTLQNTPAKQHWNESFLSTSIGCPAQPDDKLCNEKLTIIPIL